MEIKLYDSFEVREKALNYALAYQKTASDVYDVNGVIKVADVFYDWLCEALLSRGKNDAPSA